MNKSGSKWKRYSPPATLPRLLPISFLADGRRDCCSWASPIANVRFRNGPAKQARVVVGPNQLVSRDGDIPHVELMVAANPKNPKNLVGTAITNTRPEGGWACKTYASLDGGQTWTASSFAEQLEWGGADPQVAFGPHGTAYFTALASVKDEKGNTRGGLFFYRSEDGGKTWQKPTDLGYSYDHEVIAVDHTLGKFAGRIYLSALYGYPVYRLGVFRSDDDGRTFTGPVEAANGRGELGINTAANIAILRDGTLILPYEDFEFRPEKRKSQKSHAQNVWIVTSADGGITFSVPHKIFTHEFDPDPNAKPLWSFHAMAVDNQSEAFPDRLYAAWTDYRFGKPRILFSYSADRGNTWSEPKQVDGNVPQSAVQYQPIIAVNNQGTVGIAWFDTRNSSDGDAYDEYFTASVDGGETFLPARWVSSEISTPHGAGNLAMSPDAWRYKDMLRITLLAAANRWGAGGDYMGLIADRNGVFHPFWADSRTGTFQIQTAAVRVEVPEKEKSDKSAEGGGANRKESTSQNKVKTSLIGKVELVFDPAKYDPANSVVGIPIRLKNMWDRPIYGPILVEVGGFGSGEGEDFKEFAPKILNASNGKEAGGAAFDYSAALGDAQSLEPGGVSGPVVWRLKLVNPLRVPDLHLILTGYVAESK